MSPKQSFESHQVPQADNLDDIRRIVAALADAVPSQDLAERTGISSRHVSYGIQAAKTLGWLSRDERPEVSDLGRELLATAADSMAERDVYRRSITQSDVLQAVAPDLLAEVAPSRDSLTDRIRRVVPDLADETAKRRAQTLLAWRTRAMEPQLSLFAGEKTAD